MVAWKKFAIGTSIGGSAIVSSVHQDNMLHFMIRELSEPKDASPVTLSTQSHVSGEDACAKGKIPWSDLNAVHKRAAV
jgi:hypothetical protein